MENKYTEQEFDFIDEIKNKYISKTLLWDRHYQNLSHEDKEDLLSQLNLFHMELLQDKKYFSANKYKRKNWLAAAFKHQAWRFIRELRKNRNKRAKSMTELTREERFLIAVFSAPDVDPKDYETPYYEWQCMQGLTSLEQSVVLLRISDHLGDKFTYKEIKYMIKYQGTTSSLRTIYGQAINKMRNNPVLRARNAY